MASPDPDSLGATLLVWVRSYAEVEQIQDLGELSNGKALWTILQDIDADYFIGSLPEPDIEPTGDWTRKWQNLKHVEKQLAVYYRDVCNCQLPPRSSGTMPDTQAIAADASIVDLEKMLMQIIRAAMASPESNQRMGKRLLGLGNEHAMSIAYEIRSMEDAEMAPSEPVSRDESAYQSEQEVTPEPPPSTSINGAAENGGIFGDPLLEREEELLQAQATIEKLQASHATAQRQLQELRQDKEHLQEAFDAYRSEINNKGRKAAGDDAFKKLQRQAESDRAYIDNLENEIQSSRNTIENFERQLQRFKSEEEGSQKLRDDLQMIRTENEDLSQKVKANENLKKKIQALQEQEKANVTLREEIKLANDKLEELDRLKQFQAGLEKEIIEKKGLIRNQEYQINELVTTRKHAEYDARVLSQRLEAARERQDRDHEAIEELRAKLRESNADDTIELEVPDESSSSSKNKKDPDDTADEIKAPVLKNDESKNLRERLALLEQQLEAADARLKQASQRNAALEEDSRRGAEVSDAQAQKTSDRLEQQDLLIAELRKQVEIAAKLPKEPAQPQDLAALQRENRLMASAWFDLSGRLQNNGVSLGRRRVEPKSWIGKQRALVGPSSGLGHR